MKILITGASGLLGRALMRECAEHEVVGYAFSRTGPQLQKLDLCDFAAVREEIMRQQPDVVIHAAAERRPDKSAADPEATLALNVNATRNLAEACQAAGAWLLMISTDYVFDGKDAPYQVDDTPNPINFYGQSKWQGEQALWQAMPNAGVLRVPILYGQVETLAESAVTGLVSLLDQDQAPVDDWAIRYPTYVDDVALVCCQLAEKHQQDPTLSGTWHWSGNEAMTKYDMVKVMADVLSQSINHITPLSEPADDVPRPYDCALDTQVLQAMGIGRHTPFATGIAKVLRG